MVRYRFDLQAEVAKAWDWLWESRDHRCWKQENYVTASDVESRVRAAVAERLKGKPYGSEGRETYSRVQISTGSQVDLLGLCRRWLMDQMGAGRVEGHNFGRGHCSGMRFRPAGAPLGEVEQKHLETPREELARRRWIRHMASDPAEPLNGRGHKDRLCERGRKPRRFYGFPRRQFHSDVTADPSKVTCKRCLAIMAKELNDDYPDNPPPGP